MTGCKGYGLRGSDARTEIEHTKEADTPGEIPGRSGLQADRRTGNKFIMRGAWLRSKEMEEIIMTLSMKEKKILYAYGCLSHHNTVTRLKWLTALTVDPEAKRRMLGWPRRWRRRWMKAGTRIFTTICGWRWTSTAVSSAACVC